MGGGNYDMLLEAIFFLVCAWFGGRLAKVAGVSRILGEIAVGILLGPNGLDFVPFTDDPIRGHGTGHRLLDVAASNTASPAAVARE